MSRDELPRPEGWEEWFDDNRNALEASLTVVVHKALAAKGIAVGDAVGQEAVGRAVAEAIDTIRDEVAASWAWCGRPEVHLRAHVLRHGLELVLEILNPPPASSGGSSRQAQALRAWVASSPRRPAKALVRGLLALIEDADAETILDRMSDGELTGSDGRLAVALLHSLVDAATSDPTTSPLLVRARLVLQAVVVAELVNQGVENKLTLNVLVDLALGWTMAETAARRGCSVAEVRQRFDGACANYDCVRELFSSS